MFDIAALTSTGRSGAAAGAPSSHLRFVPTREERMKEVRERILIAKQIPHLIRSDCPVIALGAAAAAPAEIHVPLGRIESARPGTTAGALRLLVHLPVRAQLVIFLALVGVADDLVRFVDLLEP